MNAEERESNHPEGAGEEHKQTNEPQKKQPLIEASSRGDVKLVRSILNDENIDVNIKDTNTGLTPIKLASREGHTEVVEALLEHPDTRLRESIIETTALHLALERGHAEVVKVLLEKFDKGAISRDVSLHSEYESSEDGFSDGYLKTKHILIDAQNADGLSPLHLAAQAGHIDVVKVLLDFPEADPDSRIVGTGYTPLCFAAERGHGEVVEALIQAGSRVNVKCFGTQSGKTPLHLASEKGHLEVVKVLLRQPEIIDSINLACAGGSTPLHSAVQSGSAELVRELTKNKDIDLDLKNDAGKTALTVAEEKGHISCAEILKNIE